MQRSAANQKGSRLSLAKVSQLFSAPLTDETRGALAAMFSGVCHFLSTLSPRHKSAYKTQGVKGHYGQQVFNSGGDGSSSQPLPLSSPSQEPEDRSPIPSSPVSRRRDDRRTHSPILVGAQGRQPSDDDEEGFNLLGLAHNRQYLLRQHGYYNDYNDENDGDDGEMDDDLPPPRAAQRRKRER